MRVANFPAPGEKVSASDFIVTGGGCAANAAVAIARLKGRAAFAGPLGGEDDAVSSRIVADLAGEGVDCSGVVRVAGATASVSLILLDAAGEKTIATRRGQGLSAGMPADVEALVAEADAVLVDNRFPDFVTAVCRAARARDIGAGLAQLSAHNPGLLAVTDGPNGVTWREGENLRHLQAFQVEAIDSLGAGDAFHGAFALALAEGRDLAEAMRFAAATAALKCTRFGGAAGAPTRDEVEAFLRERAG